MVVIPKGMVQFGDEFFEGGEGWRGAAGFGKSGPFRGDGGQGGEAALGMVSGSGGGEIPVELAVGGEFVRGAVFPPGLPEGFQPLAGVGGGFFMQFGVEETGGAEEDGFDVGRVEFFEGSDGQALGEEAHGETVFGVAEGFRDGFPEGLRGAVGTGDAPVAAGFFLQAVGGGLPEEVVEGGGIHFR